MHEREISSERGAREGAMLDREQGRKELAELHTKHETVLSEFTLIRVSVSWSKMRMTRFELEKSEEYLLNLKQSQLSFSEILSTRSIDSCR